MKILVVGAGATGGYFGGRLLQAGRDVTFLVRPRRAALLAERGFTIRSRFGDFHRAAPPVVTAENLSEPFDLVLLSCKAYDLDSAIASFAPAVGPRRRFCHSSTGCKHLEILAERFGAERVLGGLCVISSTLGEDGTILHLNDLHGLTFGELDGARSERIEAIAAALLDAGFEARLSDAIRQEMWEKWLFIAAGASATCLMRASIGDIVAAGASDLATGLIDECAAIATAQGFAPRPATLAMARGALTAAGSTLTASMMRDMENGMPVEADHLIGDLLRRAGAADNRALLRIAYAHLKAYEARRAREAAARPAEKV